MEALLTHAIYLLVIGALIVFLFLDRRTTRQQIDSILHESRLSIQDMNKHLTSAYSLCRAKTLAEFGQGEQLMAMADQIRDFTDTRPEPGQTDDDEIEMEGGHFYE